MPEAAEERVPFWSVQRRGTNFFNKVPRAERFIAAQRIGIEVGRLAPNKWLAGRPESERGDFLLGSAGRFDGIPAGDLDDLVRVLDQATEARMPIVLTMLSLPGHRWRQHNGANADDVGGTQERALFEDFAWHERAAEFWRALAERLRNHPAIVGYNILNEPSPEHLAPRLRDWYTGDYDAWSARVRGTPADLSLFYAGVIRAIREVDPDTPIVLDGGYYATPWALTQLDPAILADDNIIYSLHMYEPAAYMGAANSGQYTYPGSSPVGELDPREAPVLDWDRSSLGDFFDPVVRWQRRHGIPNTRIWVSELGVHRQNPGAAAYLHDVIDVVEERGWHWAFYSYREDDGHQAMDYELGTTDTPPGYWGAWERGQFPDETIYWPNELFDVLRSRLAPGS